MHKLLSPGPWILGVKLSPDPDPIEVQETGYSELGPVWILFCSTLALTSLESRWFKS